MSAERAHVPHVFSLIIPAFNEESAVQETLRRAVDAMGRLKKDGVISDGEVILVNDGSTDATLSMAKEVPGVRIVTYFRNRGYGGAIETGFAVAKGDVLAFMDADGTCSPDCFVELWREMELKNADVVLGCRLHGRSKMPLIRRLGNIFYAWLLFAISKVKLRDTASGMRLIQRRALAFLYPLPKGLSYTPAMSAKCVMDPRLKISEVEMPYEERVGKSKLNVLRDGLRFLQVILITGVFYSPLRIFGGLGVFVIGLGVLGTLLCGWLCGGGFFLQALICGYLPLLIGTLCMAVGLTFHLFSKQILPGWPTGEIERWIAKTFRASLLLWAAFICMLLACAVFAGAMVYGILSLSFAFLLCGFLLHIGVLCVFVAVGRIIMAEINKWQHAERSREELLSGIETVTT